MFDTAIVSAGENFTVVGSVRLGGVAESGSLEDWVIEGP